MLKAVVLIDFAKFLPDIPPNLFLKPCLKKIYAGTQYNGLKKIYSVIAVLFDSCTQLHTWFQIQKSAFLTLIKFVAMTLRAAA